jgi:capsid protein
MARTPKRPTAKPAARKATAKPKAGTGSYTSTTATGRRSFLWLTAAQDNRRDLTPSARVEMLRKMRWGERNSGPVRAMVGDLVLYTVGDGFHAQPSTSDADWNARALAYWNEATKRIDVTGRFSFNDLLRIAERRWVVDGDFFLAKVRNGAGTAKLQGIEAHRVCDPLEGEPPAGMYDGVQTGAYGEITAYNVIRSDGSSRQILANAMMHVYDPEFVSGVRGLPILQHSWNDLQDHLEILALEKKAVKDHSHITRVLKRGGGEFGDMANELASNPQAANALQQGGGGDFIALEPGEDLDLKASQRPNSNFLGFIGEVLADAHRGVMPVEFNDPSKLTGAAVRLIVAKMDRVASRHQGVLIDDICNPTWGYIIGDAIANGELPDNPDWYKVSWTTPKRVTVDAGREAANDRADIEMGLMSMSELYSQRGMDFREEMDKRAQDMAFIIDLAKRNGIPVEMLYKPTNGALAFGPGTIFQTDKGQVPTQEVQEQRQDNIDQSNNQ